MIPDAAPVTMPIFQGESLNQHSTIFGLADPPLIPFGTKCPTGCLAGDAIRPATGTDHPMLMAGRQGQAGNTPSQNRGQYESRLKLLVLLRPSRMRASKTKCITSGVELFRCGAIVTRSEMQIFLRREVAPGKFGSFTARQCNAIGPL
jgi:hypothetical protein